MHRRFEMSAGGAVPNDFRRRELPSNLGRLRFWHHSESLTHGNCRRSGGPARKEFEPLRRSPSRRRFWIGLHSQSTNESRLRPFNFRNWGSAIRRLPRGSESATRKRSRPLRIARRGPPSRPCYTDSRPEATARAHTPGITLIEPRPAAPSTAGRS